MPLLPHFSQNLLKGRSFKNLNAMLRVRIHPIGNEWADKDFKSENWHDLIGFYEKLILAKP